jgi:hypothetical protein
MAVINHRHIVVSLDLVARVDGDLGGLGQLPVCGALLAWDLYAGVTSAVEPRLHRADRDAGLVRARFGEDVTAAVAPRRPGRRYASRSWLNHSGVYRPSGDVVSGTTV